MKLRLKVEHTGGDTDEVTVRPRTQVAFERHFSKPGAPVRLDDGVSMEHLYWLAWHSENSGSKFDTWLDTIEEVSPIVDDSEDDDGPLGVDRQRGTLSPPPSSQGQVSPTS